MHVLARYAPQEGRSAGNFRGTDESPPFLKVRARGHVTLYDGRRARVTCTKHRRRSRRHPDVVNELIRRRQPALARVAARAAPSPTARAVAARAAPSRSLRPESHAGVVQCSSARSRGVGGRERQWVADLDSRARAYLGAATEHLEHMATAAASTPDLSRYEHGCCLSTDQCIAPAATTSRKMHRGLVKNSQLRTLSAALVGKQGPLSGQPPPDVLPPGLGSEATIAAMGKLYSCAPCRKSFDARAPYDATSGALLLSPMGDMSYGPSAAAGNRNGQLSEPGMQSGMDAGRRSPPFTTSRTRSCTSQILMSTSWSRTAVAGPN